MRPPHISLSFLGIAILATTFDSARASDYLLEPCISRLLIELTPDVPDPHDPGFLSSLVNNHPAYQLTWVGRDDDFTIVLDLTGPGPRERCDAVVDTMRKDGRVLSIAFEAADTQTVFVFGDSASPVATQSGPMLHFSREGLGSLDWASHHLSEGVRILLPLRPGDPARADAEFEEKVGSALCLPNLDPGEQPPACP